MKQVALSEIKDDLSKYLRLAESEAIIITRHGKPAGVLRGFASEDDWFDYKLEHDPRFLQRIARARESLQAGNGVKLEDVASEPKAPPRRMRKTGRSPKRARLI
jgi:prevent-host-death family protein